MGPVPARPPKGRGYEGRLTDEGHETPDEMDRDSRPFRNTSLSLRPAGRSEPEGTSATRSVSLLTAGESEVDRVAGTERPRVATGREEGTDDRRNPGKDRTEPRDETRRKEATTGAPP